MLRLSQRSTPVRSAWVRCSSTVQSQPVTSSDTTSPLPPSSGDRESLPPRPGNWKTRRPYINPERPRRWNRPLVPGVLPAYDEALQYIRQDSCALRAETQYNRLALREAESSPSPDPEFIKGLKEKLTVLEIQSEVNRPEVRWNFRNGLGEHIDTSRSRLTPSPIPRLADMTEPVYQHLAEQKWRSEGDLDLLVRHYSVLQCTAPILNPFRWKGFTK